MKAPWPDNEAERLAALRAYHILDTAGEQVYDDMTAVAAYLCDAPIAMISLVDQCRQWFKSKIGITESETPRDVAFCAHAILKSDPLVVEDALADRRFADSTLVTGEPYVRFYAGFPLVTPEGFALGTLCVADRKPRQLSEKQMEAMGALTRQVVALLEQRRISTSLAEALDHIKTLRGLLPICAWCKRIRDDQGYWKQVEAYFSDQTGVDFTHGICPDCLEKKIQKKPPRPSRGKAAERA